MFPSARLKWNKILEKLCRVPLHSFFLFTEKRNTPLQVGFNRSKVSTFDNFPTERRTFGFNLAASVSELHRSTRNADKSRVFAVWIIIKNISFLRSWSRVYGTSIFGWNDILESRKGKQKPKRKTTKTKLNEPKEKENELWKTWELNLSTKQQQE